MCLISDVPCYKRTNKWEELCDECDREIEAGMVAQWRDDRAEYRNSWVRYCMERGATAQEVFNDPTDPVDGCEWLDAP